jgi:hypothetical protein
MNRQYNAVDPRARILFAGMAALAAVGVVWSILAPAVHCDDEFGQEAKAQPAVVMQHAQAPAAVRGAQASQG